MIKVTPPGLFFVQRDDGEADGGRQCANPGTYRLASGRLAGILARPELRVVRGADHFVSLGRPKEFNAALGTLLDRRRVEGAW